MHAFFYIVLIIGLSWNKSNSYLCVTATHIGGHQFFPRTCFPCNLTFLLSLSSRFSVATGIVHKWRYASVSTKPCKRWHFFRAETINWWNDSENASQYIKYIHQLQGIERTHDCSDTLICMGHPIRTWKSQLIYSKQSTLTFIWRFFICFFLV